MALEQNAFTASRVRKLTGVSYETLNFWAKIGLVRPSVSAASGSGTRRIYDFEDLVAIRVALKLRRAGVFGPSLVRVLELLRNSGFDSPAKVAVDVTLKGEVEINLGKGERISARRKPGQLLLDFSCDCRNEVWEVRKILDSESKRSHLADDRLSSKTTSADSAKSRPRSKRRASA